MKESSIWVHRYVAVSTAGLMVDYASEVLEVPSSAIDPPDPLDAIRFRLEQAGLDKSALIGVSSLK